jgi:hypothetical protein
MRGSCIIAATRIAARQPLRERTVIAATGTMSPLAYWAVLILCGVWFVSLVLFYLEAGTNGMPYARPAPLYVTIGCLVASPPK